MKLLLPIISVLLITLTVPAAAATIHNNVVSAAALVGGGNVQQPLQQQQQQQPLATAGSTNSTAAAAQQCLYELVVKTAAVEGAGTDARISLTLSGGGGADDDGVLAVADLASWGWLGAGYDYFEPGNLDIFGAGHACLAAMPCRMLLASDGSSGKPDWYPSMVEIIQITTELSVSVRKFFPTQWIAADRPPYQLFVYQDLCADDDGAVAVAVAA